MVDELTLLIIESPTIQKKIDHHRIPNLILFSTHGYAWIPDIDLESNTVRRYARPDLRTWRKALKATAATCPKIILALDNDLSGRFIQDSIVRFLKREDVYTTQITDWSKESVLHQIKQAQTFGEVSWSDLERSMIERVNYREDIESELLHMLRSLEVTFSQSSQDFTEWYKAQTMSWYPTSFYWWQYFYPQTKSFKEAHQRLEELFVLGNQPLIRYPRTTSPSFYSQVWQGYEEDGISNQLPVLLPALRRIATDTPHDACGIIQCFNSIESYMSVLPHTFWQVVQLVLAQQKKLIFPSYHDLESMESQWKLGVNSNSNPTPFTLHLLELNNRHPRSVQGWAKVLDSWIATNKVSYDPIKGQLRCI